MIPRRSSRLSQPQGGGEIDWGNPLALGITSVVNHNTILRPSGVGTFAATEPGGGTGKLGATQVTPAGIAVQFGNAKVNTSLDVAGIMGPNDIGPLLTGQETRLFIVTRLTADATNTAVSSTGQRAGNNKIDLRLNAGQTLAAVNSGVAVIASSSVNLAVGQTAVLAMVATPPNFLLYFNGVQVGSGSATFTVAQGVAAMGGGVQNAVNMFDSHAMPLHVAYNRALTPEEIRALSANPWQIFRSTPRYAWPVTLSAGGASTITPAAGTSTTATATGAATTLATQTAASGSSVTSTFTASAIASAVATVAGGTSVASTLTGASLYSASITPASGTSTTGTLAPSGSSAATITPANGTSTVSNATGRATAASVVSAANGTSTTGTLVGSSGGANVADGPPIGGFVAIGQLGPASPVASGSVITPANGTSVTGTLSGMASVSAAIVGASGTSVTSTMVGASSSGTTATMTPASGSSVTSTMVGSFSAVVSASMVSANGTSITSTMVGFPPSENNADTHDGYFHKLWAKLAKKPERDLEVLIDRLEEVEQEIEEVKAAPIPKQPIYLQSVPIPPFEAQAKLLQALILESARIRRDIEDEEEAEILLML